MELDVKPLLDTDALKNFWCGIEDMDRFIHERLFHSVKYNFCKLFAVVTKNNEIVAMFALSFDSLKLDSNDKYDLRKEYSNTSSPIIPTSYKDTFWSKAHYPALEISYLAVSKQYQRKGIGRDIVKLIVDKAKEQDLAGCQFITVEAYCTKEYSAVGFYHNCGFARSDIYPMYDTIRMYRNLLE